jgi:serine/threonine protein phosphatase PrpC
MRVLTVIVNDEAITRNRVSRGRCPHATSRHPAVTGDVACGAAAPAADTGGEGVGIGEPGMSARAHLPDEPRRKPLAPRLSPAVVTTRGRRETNQDRVCALRTLVGGEPAVLLAVADGVGGLPAGEQAAELALQVVGHYAHYVLPDTDPGPALRDAVGDMLRAASRRIWLWARDRGHGGAAGSTLVCALVWDRRFLVAHAGDSRCYRIDAGGAHVLTRDHTEAARRDPRPGPASAPGRRSPLSHYLTSALGWPTETLVETTPPGVDPGTLERDGVLLVCSDGLHGVVGEEDMHAAVRETRGVEDACRRLVALALERGSTDNISVAAVEVGSLPRRCRRCTPA